MDIDKIIEQWVEKHSSILNDYSKGNANNEVMQMYRSQMKDILDFISELKQVKIHIDSIPGGSAFEDAIKYAQSKYVDDSKGLQAMLLGDVAELLKMTTGKEVDWSMLVNPESVDKAGI